MYINNISSHARQTNEKNRTNDWQFPTKYARRPPNCVPGSTEGRSETRGNRYDLPTHKIRFADPLGTIVNFEQGEPAHLSLPPAYRSPYQPDTPSVTQQGTSPDAKQNLEKDNVHPKKSTPYINADEYQNEPAHDNEESSEDDTDNDLGSNTDDLDHDHSSEARVPNDGTEVNLRYVIVQLGHKSGKSDDTPICLDNGANFNYLSFDVLESIPNHKQYITGEEILLVKTPKTYGYQDVTNAKIPITFTDKRHVRHTVTLDFKITDLKEQSAYLGCGFLNEDKYIHCMQPGFLNIRNPGRRSKCAAIPIHRLSEGNKTALLNCIDVTIPANSMQFLQAFAATPVPGWRDMIVEDIDDDDEECDPPYTIHATKVAKSDFDIYPVAIQNNTSTPMTFTCNTPIAYIYSDNSEKVLHINHLEITKPGDRSTDHFYATEQCNHHSTTNKNQQQKREKYPTHRHDLSDVSPAMRHQFTAMEDTPDGTPTHATYELEKQKQDKVNPYHRAENERIIRAGPRHTNANKQGQPEPLVPEKIISDSNQNGTQNMTTDCDHSPYTQEVRDRLLTEPSCQPLSVTDIIENDRKLTVMTKEETPMTDDEAIAAVDLSHLKPEIAVLVQQILRKHVSVLAKSQYDLPPTDYIEADIQLKESALSQCLRCTHSPIPAHLIDEVEVILRQMIRAGIVVQTNDYSPILNAILVSRKSSGKLRVLLDARLLNVSSHAPVCAATPLNAVFAHLNQARYVTVVDATNAFFTIPVAPAKVPLLSFMFKNKKYALRRLPMGWKGSPAYLEALIGKAIEDVPQAINFADDIIVASSDSPEHHLNILDKLLENCNALNIRLNTKKLAIMHPDLTIVGFRYHLGKLSIPVARANAIAEHPTPTTAKRLRGLTGHIDYYSDTMPKLAEIKLPLHKIEQEFKTKKYIKWTPAGLQALEDVKAAVANSISLSPLMVNEPIFMSSDASCHTVAGLIWQKDPETGETRYLGASSRLLDKREQRWSTFRKETAAVLLMLHTHDWMLRGAPHITAYTDAMSLLWLRGVKNKVSILFRFSQTIATYNIEIIHISGSANDASDYLSRSLFPEDMPEAIGMSETTGNELFKQLTLPDGFKIDKDLLRQYMTDDGLEEVVSKKRLKKQQACSIQINDSNNRPSVKRERKVKPPPTRRERVPTNKIEEHSTFFEKAQPHAAASGQDQQISTPSSGVNPISTQPPLPRTDNGPTERNTTEHEEEDYLIYKDYPVAALNEIRVLYETPETGIPEDSGHNDPEPGTPMEGTDPNDSEPIDPIEGADPTESHPTSQETTGERHKADIDHLRINQKILSDGLISVDTFRRAQETDETFGPYLTGDKALPANWSIDKGILLHVSRDTKKLMLPVHLLEALYNTKHLSLYARHAPHSSLYSDISRHYWHPQLHQLLKTKTRQCTICKLTKKQKIPQNTLGGKVYSTSRTSVWNYDCAGGLPVCQGKAYVFVFVCSLTMYTQLFAASTKSAPQLLKAFKQLLATFGPCKALYADNDPAVLSTIFKDYCHERNIDIQTTSPHSAWANALSERTIALAKETIRTHTMSTGQPWTELLPEVQMALNSRLLVGSRFSPNELLFGSETPVTDLLARHTYTSTQEEYVRTLMTQLQESRMVHLERRNARIIEQRNYENRTRRERHFQVDQVVYYRNLDIPNREIGGAIFAPQRGPYVILQIADSGRTARIQHLQTNDIKICHTTHIIPATESHPTNPIPLGNHAYTLLRPTNQQETETRRDTTPEPVDSNHGPIQQPETIDEQGRIVRRSGRIRQHQTAPNNAPNEETPHHNNDPRGHTTQEDVSETAEPTIIETSTTEGQPLTHSPSDNTPQRQPTQCTTPPKPRRSDRIRHQSN